MLFVFVCDVCFWTKNNNNNITLFLALSLSQVKSTFWIKISKVKKKSLDNLSMIIILKCKEEEKDDDDDDDYISNLIYLIYIYLKIQQYFLRWFIYK